MLRGSLILALLACAAAGPGCESSPAGESSAASAPSSPAASAPPSAPLPPGNVILLIADDFGVDSAPFYADKDGDGLADDGRSYGPMPNLGQLCRDGVQFTQAWAAPTCSPTRATILTGRYSFRTGIGTAVTGNTTGLKVSEPSLPRVARAALSDQIATANLGKWHLGITAELGGKNAPNTMGWAHYAGNLQGALPSYTGWQKTVNGQSSATTRYATTDTIDDAIAWLSGPAKDRQFLLWIALNAPHTPLHLPPPELHTQGGLSGDDADISARPLAYYFAMLEAMDREVGRLLAFLKQEQLDQGTTILFLGDNGTAREVVQAPALPSRAKDSLYEGGIHVPLCISGPAVVGKGRKVEAPVHSVDLYATALGLLGVDVARAVPTPEIDSVSLLPYLQNPGQKSLRTSMISEAWGGMMMEGKAIRDERYKLLRVDAGPGGARTELYDLSVDPLETTDLLATSPLPPEVSARAQGFLDVLAQIP